MTTDDLTTPLGQDAKPKPAWLRLPPPPKISHLVVLALALVLLTFLGFAIFSDDQLGGEPAVRIAIAPSPNDAGPTMPANSAKPAAPPATAMIKQPSAEQRGADQKTVTIIDGSNGTRHDVTVPTADSDVPQGGSTPTVVAAVNPQLLEQGHYGMIPITAGGLKASQVYAAGGDALRAKAATMPAIAIVIGGLGIGAARTTDAIVKLPGAVTLAFTPYGADPAKLVERARAQGHEILLQVPLEPFDYPDNDPGPQTLLTTLSAEQNLDRLDWLMSRFQGYVGLTNFMGARFLPSEAAMQPLIREAAKRGLAYFDDGTSARSLAAQLSLEHTVPFSKADLTIDAVPTVTEIDRALAQLETIARQRGFAVGVASALPLSIDRLSAWAKALDGRGILLVPLTTAMMKSKSS